MKCFIGLGTNLGNRRENLQIAAQKLQSLSRGGLVRLSPLYENAALVPEGAPVEWRQSYLNAVAEIEWVGSPQELLQSLKGIEKEMGRSTAQRWAPRIIDLDILIFGDLVLSEENLEIPHAGVFSRSFVLDPLKDLDCSLWIPGSAETALSLARKQRQHSPCVMGILNLTPDSFSDGGELSTLDAVETKIRAMEESGVHAMDIGAESTRPGAIAINLDEEQKRLEPVMEILRGRHDKNKFRPALSIDTRRPEIAKAALDCGFDCINDVSGLADEGMINILAESSCDYVLMHSLTVPANPQARLSADIDPVPHLKEWLNQKLELIDARGIDLKRIIFDPGIGFGKTPAQSWTILKRLDEFQDIPVRILMGHSRKGYLKSLGIEDRNGLDAATLAVSLSIARYTDILRVHDFKSHLAAFRTKMEFEQ